MNCGDAGTYGAESGRRSSDAGVGAVLQGPGAQLQGRDLWGSGGGGWLALGCLRLGRQIQGLSALVLQKSNTFGPVWFFSSETWDPIKTPSRGVKSADCMPKKDVFSKCGQTTRKGKSNCGCAGQLKNLLILDWLCALPWHNQHAAHPCSIKQENRDKASIPCKETCLGEKIHTHLPNMLRIEKKTKHIQAYTQTQNGQVFYKYNHDYLTHITASNMFTDVN